MYVQQFKMLQCSWQHLLHVLSREWLCTADFMHLSPCATFIKHDSCGYSSDAFPECAAAVVGRYCKKQQTISWYLLTTSNNRSMVKYAVVSFCSQCQPVADFMAGFQKDAGKFFWVGASVSHYGLTWSCDYKPLPSGTQKVAYVPAWILETCSGSPFISLIDATCWRLLILAGTQINNKMSANSCVKSYFYVRKSFHMHCICQCCMMSDLHPFCCSSCSSQIFAWSTLHSMESLLLRSLPISSEQPLFQEPSMGCSISLQVSFPHQL